MEIEHNADRIGPGPGSGSLAMGRLVMRMLEV